MTTTTSLASGAQRQVLQQWRTLADNNQQQWRQQMHQLTASVHKLHVKLSSTDFNLNDVGKDLLGVPICLVIDDALDYEAVAQCFENRGAVLFHACDLKALQHFPIVVDLTMKTIPEALPTNCIVFRTKENLKIYTRKVHDLELLLEKFSIHDKCNHKTLTVSEDGSEVKQLKLAIPENATLFNSDVIHSLKALIGDLREMGVTVIHRNLSDFTQFVDYLNQSQIESVKKLIKRRSEFLEPRILEIVERIDFDHRHVVNQLCEDVIQSFESKLSGFVIPHGYLSEEVKLPTIVFPMRASNGKINHVSIIGSKPLEEALIQVVKKLSTKKPFTRVLIANRGEIAVRIIKTLRKMGIISVAIHSTSDAHAPHVDLADEAIQLQGHTVPETYTNIAQIVAIAQAAHVEAIIPGYGFLAENAEFARACAAAGVVFIGPRPETIEALGLKHSAREIAIKAQVPLVPGSGLVGTLEEALKAADSLGYPVMVKSTAGGGGIGLQKAASMEELIQKFSSVQRLGLTYFNNPDVFLERFIPDSRHVEVQILGDGNGNAMHVGDRDCTLQRRNQKVVEEAPAPNIPEAVRRRMRAAAVRLGQSVKYKGAGTVEFMYDEHHQAFYFLEVNTRLQVEHPVTEAVSGLDLIEWMLWIGADQPPLGFRTFKDQNVQKIDLHEVSNNEDSMGPSLQGVAIEVRVYAENPVKGFIPSPGQIIDLQWPPNARVDTWVKKGSTITTEYDPLIAKIIVHADSRIEAIQQMRQSLNLTQIHGILTNLDYLKELMEIFATAQYHTKSLDEFVYTPKAFEILEPGGGTTIQDYPGRVGYWNIGIPPSGPMDDYAFRAGNRIVGNDPGTVGLEFLLNGPTILFHSTAVVAITGGETKPFLDGKPMETWKPVNINPGQKLTIGRLTTGCRGYLAIRGGLNVPEFLGSQSTFALGNLGRVLRFGDVIFLKDSTLDAIPTIPRDWVIPKYGNSWEVGVVYGPHGSPDFFTSEGIATFLESMWKVHYNSNRFGVRLQGPQVKWARVDGGEAGLHPSNAHDYVYPLGGVNFTGDEPVILTCDGPSLGGFVCPFTVAEAEMWKIGQVKPGDVIRFKVVTWAQALEARRHMETAIETGCGLVTDCVSSSGVGDSSPILFQDDTITRTVYRQAGDRYILIEYGDDEFDIQHTHRIYLLKQALLQTPIPGVLELCPGVRSATIIYDGALISQLELIQKLVTIHGSLKIPKDGKVPSRILHLPLAFEDSATLSAVERYQETIRADAPWLPNNVDFLKEINNLQDRNQIQELMFQATFLVLGLGDVFLGAPCAVPLDPRHRLLGTKYNPSRSWTPNGTVGLGGMYMCIYTMESPGGYQLIGRTVPIWDKLTLNQKNPWLLEIFDQIRYYPVTEAKLAELTALAHAGKYDFEILETTFDFGSYYSWLEKNGKSIAEHNRKLKAGNSKMAELIKTAANENSVAAAPRIKDVGEDVAGRRVYCEVVGRVWKCVAQEGCGVQEGETLVVVEAMKAEMAVVAPCAGVLRKLCCCHGDFVEAGDLIAIIE